MPTTYAHWRFGADCIETMPDNLKQIVNNNRDLFNIGVHGPDIFFYDLTNHKFNEYGFKMHDTPANNFFEKCKVAYKNNNEKQQMLAYILGFLSHFALDSTCHGYIERKREVSGVSHNLIESQWDKHIMMLEGKDTKHIYRSATLKPTDKTSKIIAHFHPFDEKTILKGTKAHHFIINALHCSNKTKDRLLRTTLHRAHKDDYKDLLIGFADIDECKDSNLRLDKLRQKAIELYPELLNNLINYLNDQEELISYFEHDFDPWSDYKDIKILSYEQELDYKV